MAVSHLIDYCQKIVGTNPKFPNAHYLLGLAYAQKGDNQQAIEAFETVRSLAGDNPLWDAMLGYTHGKAGKRADANKHLAGLNEQARGKYIPPVYQAIVYAGLGDSE
jgi:Flp pilus assembly protein TadD